MLLGLAGVKMMGLVASIVLSGNSQNGEPAVNRTPSLLRFSAFSLQGRHNSLRIQQLAVKSDLYVKMMGAVVVFDHLEMKIVGDDFTEFHHHSERIKELALIAQNDI
jgi:hypothetical protein